MAGVFFIYYFSNMFLVIVLIIITHLLAIGSIILIVKTFRTNNSHWLINNLLAVLLFSFVYFGGLWIFSSIYFKYIYAFIAIIAMILAGVFQFAFRKSASYLKKKRLHNTQRLVSKSILAIGLLIVNIILLKGYFYPHKNAIDLQFPLRNGEYYVLQGGNSPISNVFHRSHTLQKYGFDFVKLNSLGNRADGLLPENNDEYEIYGDTIYSPIAGVISTATDGVEENKPPKMNRRETLGNYVIIKRQNYYILLAHMIPGQLFVTQGEAVEKGQPLGLVGNSGRSIEPHLHIHVLMKIENGEIVSAPFSFGREYYSLNSLIESTQN